jgi:tol-pal system protein YbgF
MNYVRGEVSKLQDESQTIKTQSAGSYSEITHYREEISALNGSIEELRHNYTTSVRRQDVEDSLMVRKADAIEARLTKIELALGLSEPDSKSPLTVVPAPSGNDATPAAATPAPAVESKPAAPSTEDALLKEGLSNMGKADYAGARESFTQFMTQNPKSIRVGDAQFYIAESYYNEKWYEKAILEYQVVIAKYTKSNRRAAALYKQGLSFEKIGDVVNAKARFKDVVNVYPSSPEARLAKKKIK